MTFLPQLHQDLLDAHARLASRRSRRVMRWLARQRRPTPAALLLVGAGLVIASGAAASGLLFNVSSPLRPAPQPYAVVQKDALLGSHGGQTPANAAQLLRQVGRPLPATAATHVLQPDPEGGPPWGVLVYRTTTGVVCSHSGRVVDGRVGLLDADHGLHPWTPDLSGCDIGTDVRVVDAQGGILKWDGSLSCIQRAVLHQSTLPLRRRARLRVCSPNELRGIIDGVLPNKGARPDGSRPTSITFTLANHKFTEPTPEGAFVYLNQHGLGCSAWPRITITYADGSTSTDSGPDFPEGLCAYAGHSTRSS